MLWLFFYVWHLTITDYLIVMPDFPVIGNKIDIQSSALSVFVNAITFYYDSAARGQLNLEHLAHAQYRIAAEASMSTERTSRSALDRVGIEGRRRPFGKELGGR